MAVDENESVSLRPSFDLSDGNPFTLLLQQLMQQMLSPLGASVYGDELTREFGEL